VKLRRIRTIVEHVTKEVLPRRLAWLKVMWSSDSMANGCARRADAAARRRNACRHDVAITVIRGGKKQTMQAKIESGSTHGFASARMMPTFEMPVPPGSGTWRTYDGPTCGDSAFMFSAGS